MRAFGRAERLATPLDAVPPPLAAATRVYIAAGGPGAPVDAWTHSASVPLGRHAPHLRRVRAQLDAATTLCFDVGAQRALAAERECALVALAYAPTLAERARLDVAENALACMALGERCDYTDIDRWPPLDLGRSRKRGGSADDDDDEPGIDLDATAAADEAELRAGDGERHSDIVMQDDAGGDGTPSTTTSDQPMSDVAAHEGRGVALGSVLDEPFYALERAAPLPQFDGRVRLVEATHRYYVDGVYDEHAVSVTTWVAQCRETFDAPRIVANMLERGTATTRAWYASALLAASNAWALADTNAPLADADADAIEHFLVGQATYGAVVARAAGSAPVRAFVECARTAIVEYVCALWDANGAAASGAGTQMHERIEAFYRGVLPRGELEALATRGEREYAHFLAFHDAEVVGGDLEPVRMELVVYDTDGALRVRGAIDGVFRCRSTGRLRLIDWKRWKAKDGEDPRALAKTGFRGKKQRAPLAHLDDCDWEKYCMQQAAYIYLLERYSDWRIADGAYLAVFHPDRPSYIFEKTADRSGEIEVLARMREAEVKTLPPPPVQ